MTEETIIKRVQALLAKAESTQFEHEADAFYAKAEELMTKHAIERWQLAQAKGVTEKPVKRTIIYSTNDANLPGKKTLLVAAGKASGCQIILAPGTKKQQAAFIVGFAADAEYAELLYTSLLVQAMRFAPREVRRVKSKLTDYLLGFGYAVIARINERQEAAQASEDSDLLPALRSREAEVADAVRNFFPRLGKSRAVARRTDWAAQQAGHAAGQRADITAGRGTVGGNRKELG